jgi:hypothetical protein
MSLQHLTLGERIVMAARVMAAEHLRQEADEAGINVRLLQREMEMVRQNEARQGRAPEAALRQDLFRQPAATAAAVGGDDDRRVA